MPKSLVVPFNVSGGHIGDTQSNTRITEQKIINVLTTGQGERITLPLYGAGIQQLLFEGVDELTEVDFTTDATSELASNVSNLSVIDLRVIAIGPTEAQVTVSYRTPLNVVQQATFTVAIPGQLNEESPI